jgi:hypothetical protein
MEYLERKTCRVDGTPLKTILDLGNIYPSTFIEDGPYDQELEKVPLILTRGEGSNLVQLKHTVNRDFLYRKYWYRSQLNSSMVRSLEDIVTNIRRKTSFFSDDVIVDIGCNDGTMLALFPTAFKVGVDPANNLSAVASKNCDLFINDYFDDRVLGQLPKKAKVITSIAMFYDLEDPNEFVKNVAEMLEPYGIWVIQLTDLLSMFKINAFDNIVHEHLEYYSLDTLDALLRKYGLCVFDVQYNDVNGGSIRAYISQSDKWIVNDSVERALKKEAEYMASFDDPFEDFKRRSEKIKKSITTFIRDMRLAGKSVYGLGASTKGNTLLQYFDLTQEDVQGIGEINPDKFGLRTVGSNIPILPEIDVIENITPDYCLVLPWHFIRGITERCARYLEMGGQLIVPCPEPRIITRNGSEWI